MLQFIAEQSKSYSIAEQVKIAIDAGCAWIQLHLPNAEDEQIRATVAEIAPLCRETGVILMLEDHINLAQELGLHGVHLTDAGANARQVRQDLGAEAIIGINVTSAQGIPTLQKLDIDYVTIAPEISFEQAKEIIDTVRGVDCEMPIVLTGDFNCLDIATIRNVGASGISTGAKLMQESNPTEAIKQLLTALQQ